MGWYEDDEEEHFQAYRLVVSGCAAAALATLLILAVVGLIWLGSGMGMNFGPMG